MISIVIGHSLKRLFTFNHASTPLQKFLIHSKILDSHKTIIEIVTFPLRDSLTGIQRPVTEKLIGNRITAVKISNGAIHVTMGNKATAAR